MPCLILDKIQKHKKDISGKTGESQVRSVVYLVHSIVPLLNSLVLNIVFWLTEVNIRKSWVKGIFELFVPFFATSL